MGASDSEVRLIPPVYVKPFVKRQKDDTADAEAIAEACSRPTMRYVAVKTEEQQARVMIFRTRDLLVRQRTQLINALRGHLAEHGVVAPQGPANLKVLARVLEDADCALPAMVRKLGRFSWNRSSSSAARSPMSRRLCGGKPNAGMKRADCSRCPALDRSPPWLSTPSLTDVDLQARARLRRLARARTSPAFHGWQAAAWPNIENGTARYSPSSHHRRHVRGAMGIPPWHPRRVVAAANDGSKAANAGGNGFGEQNGTVDLGNVDKAGELQRASRRSCVSEGCQRRRSDGWTCEEVLNVKGK
jgi:transposase